MLCRRAGACCMLGSTRTCGKFPRSAHTRPVKPCSTRCHRTARERHRLVICGHSGDGGDPSCAPVSSAQLAAAIVPFIVVIVGVVAGMVLRSHLRQRAGNAWRPGGSARTPSQSRQQVGLRNDSRSMRSPSSNLRSTPRSTAQRGTSLRAESSRLESSGLPTTSSSARRTSSNLHATPAGSAGHEAHLRGLSRYRPSRSSRALASVVHGHEAATHPDASPAARTASRGRVAGSQRALSPRSSTLSGASSRDVESPRTASGFVSHAPPIRAASVRSTPSHRASVMPAADTSTAAVAAFSAVAVDATAAGSGPAARRRAAAAELRPAVAATAAVAAFAGGRRFGSSPPASARRLAAMDVPGDNEFDSSLPSPGLGAGTAAAPIEGHRAGAAQSALGMASHHFRSFNAQHSSRRAGT